MKFTQPRTLLITLTIALFGLSSCAYMFNELLFPRSCERCTVTDDMGNVIWEEDECGGSSHNTEEKCKIKAYDNNGTCNCETYRIPKEEVSDSDE